METLVLLGLASIALAFANGANDNFKGVATLYGGRTLTYRWALAWATLTTLLGSLAAIAVSSHLVQRFSGKGLVADSIAAEPTFPMAVALGAALSVLMATRLGFPISTTHAITGGLLGAGLTLAGPSRLGYGVLASAFVLPLLLGPLLALLLAAALQRSARTLLARLQVSAESCVCVAAETRVAAVTSSAAFPITGGITLAVDHVATCARRYGGRAVGVPLRAGFSGLHVLSAGAVGFARGLNDTPKVAAVMVGSGALGLAEASLAAAVAMAAGGVLAARRVAETLSFRITGMDELEALSANVVTAALVSLATPFGLPLSTTHVSCGALFGIGMAGGRARWSVVAQIVAAWLTTLPLAALLAALAASGLPLVCARY
jgi:PiT family inorganic phosphate transporter